MQKYQLRLVIFNMHILTCVFLPSYLLTNEACGNISELLPDLRKKREEKTNDISLKSLKLFPVNGELECSPQGIQDVDKF